METNDLNRETQCRQRVEKMAAERLAKRGIKDPRQIDPAIHETFVDGSPEREKFYDQLYEDSKQYDKLMADEIAMVGDR